MLKDNRALMLGWNGSGNGYWYGVGARQALTNMGNPTARQMRILIDEGWIEPAEDSGRYFRLSDAGRHIYETAREVEYSGSGMILTEHDVFRALNKRWGRDWYLFPQIRLRGYQDTIVDALAIQHARGPNLVRIFEIKTSRADFLSELKNPRKRINAMELANDFYFAAPVGIIKEKEVPEGCGLAEVHRGGKVYVTLEAPHSASESPTWPLVVGILKAISK
jgi:hypothetical protein